MKKTILKLNTQLPSGRTFTHEAAQYAIGQLDGKPCPGLMGILSAIERANLMRGCLTVERMSHQFNNVRIEGDEIVGELETLKTPQGLILQGLLDKGVDIAYTPAGLVSYKDNVSSGEVVLYTFICTLAELAGVS